MGVMRCAWLLAAVIWLPAFASGQATGTLRIKVTVLDAAGTPTPVPRHALLVSDNPATREPRRILTSIDGSVAITLPPGSYTVESDRPVAFLGRGYQWTQMVDVAPGRDAMLELTAANAEMVQLADAPSAAGGPSRDRDALFPVAQWEPSLVEVWSPTAHATGFLIDARGLIATDQRAIGEATAVAVQTSPAVKVPARALAADGTRDVAILWVHPSVVSAATPVPLTCPPSAATALDEGQEVVSITAPLARPRDQVSGEVTALQPRAVETDFRLPFGGAGSPVFNEAGAVVGLTSVREDKDPRRPDHVAVVRLAAICAAIAAASPQLSGASPPEPTRLPVESARSSADRTRAAVPEKTQSPRPEDTPTLTSSDFDVAFLTPTAVRNARRKADWTGGRSTRSEEAEARLGRLTDFGAWSPYFADDPAVLVVRVTPKLVEGFWKRLAREAASTQGAILPAFKDFNTSFVRMRASCGGADVTPIQPFVLEHRVSEKRMVREGLYVFDPAALGPQCDSVTLSLYSEKAPAKADTVAIPQPLLDRIRQDLPP
jgi:hypothetical protein